MSLTYQIEKTKIIDLKTYRCIITQGYCFDEDQKLNYQVYVNGELSEFAIQKINRKDIMEKFKNSKVNASCGFYIRILIPLDIDLNTLSLQVYNDTFRKSLLDMSKQQIQQCSKGESIEYAVDFYHYSDKEKNNGLIQGWAISRGRNKDVLIGLLDDTGRQVPISVIKKKRDDLLHMNIVDQDTLYSGFEIMFNAKKKAKYTITFDNQEDKILYKLNRGNTIKKLKQLLILIKKYFHWRYFKKGIIGVRKYGLRKMIQRIKHPGYNLNEHYPLWFDQHKVSEETLLQQRETTFVYEPTISVIVPTFNTPLQYLHEMITSVLNQSYQNFELCIADGSTDAEVVNIICEYAKKDNRIKYCLLDKNYGIAGNTNKALALATGDYVGLFDHDDLLTPDCLFEVVSALQETKHDIIYTDEDKTDSYGRTFTDPNFKPDFNLDLFCSHNYITHFFVVKHDLITEVDGFREAFDGSQDYDLMFRCIEKASSIYHIPKILYHWRIHEDSTAGNPASKMYCYEAGRKAIEEHYERVGVHAKVEIMDLWGMYHTVYETPGNPLISIIIPNKDQIDLLNNCIASLYKKSSYTNFEIIIVENNSTQESTFTYYEKLQKKYSNIQVVNWKHDFNYSAINNYGVTFAKGEYILLLNNDTEMITATALSEMLGCCMRDEVGIVGAKLLYDDDTVQHAGIVLGFGGFAGHVFTGITKDDLGFMVRARINCDYSAVTAACMLIKKTVYDQVQGLSEEFKVALNDVDFCLKVRNTGKLVVFNAFSLWYHYESKSRGYEDTPEKKQRFEGEVRLFQERWHDVLEAGDPYYNKNFPVALGPFVLGSD